MFFRKSAKKVTLAYQFCYIYFLLTAFSTEFFSNIKEIK